jgi:hypothetical protein
VAAAEKGEERRVKEGVCEHGEDAPCFLKELVYVHGDTPNVPQETPHDPPGTSHGPQAGVHVPQEPHWSGNFAARFFAAGLAADFDNATLNASDKFHVFAPFDTKVSLPLKGTTAIPAVDARVDLTASPVSKMVDPTKFFAPFPPSLLCLQFQVSMAMALTTIPLMLGMPALSRSLGTETLSLILTPVIDLGTLLYATWW